MEILTKTHLTKITHVIHLSDVHLRTGDAEKSRSNDFSEVIINFEKMIS